MIKAVVFDIGSVLADHDWTVMRTYFSDHFNVAENEFDRAIAPVQERFQRGLITEHEMWRMVTNTLHLPPITSPSLWLDGILTTYRERPEMFDFVKHLRTNGVKTGVLSNIEQPVADYFHNRHKDSFDYHLYSCELHMAKPEPAIFEETIRRLGTAAADIIFVDDKAENTAAAAQCGIQAFHFTTVKSATAIISDIMKL